MNYDFSSIFSLRDTLQAVIQATVAGDLNAPQNFRFAVSQQSILSTVRQEDDRFRILEGADAITEYARWYILSCGSVDLSTLHEFAHDIECYTKAENQMITTDMVRKVRAFLDQEFNFTEKVLSKYPISVSIIDAAHNTCNGFVTAYWTSERSEGATFLFRMGSHSDSRKNPASVLLHELGHHIYLCAAGNEFEVPKDFRDLLGFMNIDASKMKDEDILETFADILIAATTAKTKEFGDPFPNLPQNVREMCFRYIKRVIDDI